MSEKPRNAADPEQLKDQRLTDLQVRIRDENDIRTILSLPEGHRLIARILCICGHKEPYFHPNNSTMSEVAGRRSVGYQIERMIRDTEYALWLPVDKIMEEYRPKPEPIKPGKVSR